MGVNVTRLKVRAFIFAAFFAGVAGALYAHQQGNLLRPIDAGFQRSFDVVIMVVLAASGRSAAPFWQLSSSRSFRRCCWASRNTA
jgi:ABC-type branched-subunit amino acid transport system permease subunit